MLCYIYITVIFRYVANSKVYNERLIKKGLISSTKVKSTNSIKYITTGCQKYINLYRAYLYHLFKSIWLVFI